MDRNNKNKNNNSKIIDNAKKKIIKEKDNFIRSVMAFNKRVSGKATINSKKINEYIKDKVKDPDNRRLFKTLIVVLLAITILLLRNSSVVIPIVNAFLAGVKTHDTDLYNTFNIIINNYISYYKGLDNKFEMASLGYSTLLLFVDEIPNMVRNIKYMNKIDNKYVIGDLLKNTANIIKNFKKEKNKKM